MVRAPLLRPRSLPWPLCPVSTARRPLSATPPRREYPDAPRVGVAATVLSLRTPRRVLLVARGRPPNADLWCLPGGLVEVGEGLADAAVREVREETGLRPQLLRPEHPDPTFFVTEAIFRGEEDARTQYHYVLCHVLCFADDTIEPVAADDAPDACWVEADAILEESGRELPARVGQMIPKTRDVVQAALALAGPEELAAAAAAAGQAPRGRPNAARLWR